jgi:hypothetical protein
MLTRALLGTMLHEYGNRVSDTIRIIYADTHFVKRKTTEIVYPSIRIRVPLGVFV